MIFLAVVVSYLGSQEWHVHALPVVSSTYTGDVLSPRDESESFDERSALSVLWSCLSTLFLCSWVALHPDVPPLGCSKWRIWRFRLKMMVYLLLVPELVIWWAARQYYSAKDVMRRQNENGHEWTMTHAFFYTMGGFVLNVNKETRVVLRWLDGRNEHRGSDWKYSSGYYGDGDISWPTISEEEILDRSKADVLSKGIALLQTSWFIAQCISRLAFQISITELEVVTLAFATLNGVVYFLWWHKPCDVRFGVSLYLKSTKIEPQPRPSSAIRMSTATTENALATTPPRDYLKLGIPGDSQTPAPPPSHFRRHPTPAIQPYSSDSLLSVPLVHQHSPCGLLLQACSTKPLRLLGKIGLESITFVCAGAYKLVRTFVSDMMDMTDGEGDFYSTSHSANATVVVLLTGVVTFSFGAIHFIGWSYNFPSVTEKWLWRTATIGVCGAPFTMIAGYYINKLWWDFENAILDWVVKVLLRFAIITFFLLPPIVYLVSRLMLLSLPFVALRALPPSALLELEWTTLFPHI